MKKTFLTVIVVLTAMISLAHAQVNDGSSAHLTFKGVPIDGKLSQYIVKMEKSGFAHIGTEEGIAFFEGEFASYPGCFVFVVSLKEIDLVGKVAVVLPESDTWSILSNNYFTLKELLTEKYGEPSEIVEEFVDGEPSNDDMKMLAVKMDKCKYITSYETEKGTIDLSIEHQESQSCSVLIQYYDKINGDIIRAKAIDDL